MSAITLNDGLEDKHPIPGTDLLGFGINPYGDCMTALNPVCDTQGTEVEWKFDDKTTYYHGKNVKPSPDTSGQETKDAFLEREEYQSSINVRLDIKGKYGAFNGRFSATFGRDYEAFIENAAALRTSAVTKWKLQLVDKTVTTEFKNAVDALPADFEGHEAAYYRIFDHFGAYVVTEVTVGGSMEYGVLVRREHVKDKSELELQVSTEFGACFEGSGGVKEREEMKRSSTYCHRTLTTRGGSSGTFDLTDPKDWSHQFIDWQNSIPAAPVVVSLKLTAITDSSFITNSHKQSVMAKAHERYMASFATVESNWDQSTINVSGGTSKAAAVSGPSLRVVFIDRTTLKREETAFPAPDPGSSEETFRTYWSGVHDLLVRTDPQDKMLLLATERWPRDLSLFPAPAVKEELLRHGASRTKLDRWYLLSKNALRNPVAGLSYVLAGAYGAKKGMDALAVGFGAQGNLSPTAKVAVLLPHENDGRVQAVWDGSPSEETGTSYYVIQNWSSASGPVLAAELNGSTLLLQNDDPKKPEQYWYKHPVEYDGNPHLFINYLTCGVIEGKPGAAHSAVTPFPSPLQEDWMWDIRGDEGTANFKLLYMGSANWNLASAEGTRVQVRTWEAEDHAMLWRQNKRMPTP